MCLSLLHIVPCLQEQFADLLLPFIMALLLVTVLEPVKQALVGAGGRCFGNTWGLYLLHEGTFDYLQMNMMSQ